MNIHEAMAYAKSEDLSQQSLIDIRRHNDFYCAFILDYSEDIDDENRYTIHYTGTKFTENPFDAKTGNYDEGDVYSGSNLEELKDDMSDIIDPEKLNFLVHSVKPELDLILPYLYQEILPGTMPDIDQVHTPQQMKAYLKTVNVIVGCHEQLD